MRTVVTFFLIIFSLHLVQAQAPIWKTDQDITTGARQFDRYLDLLSNQSVGFVGNHTSMIGDTHVVDALLKRNVQLEKVFAPEHGFRGTADAGEKVLGGKDPATGLEVISLYGDHKKPTPTDLDGLDIVVFDIQDVGARFYTYISTMTYVMEACAEADIPVVILDRPNPNGFYVDGPVLKEEFKSFVGMHPIPVVHGMTVGELAQMINGEGWLENGVTCDLTVIPCEGYSHDDLYVLPHSPSPNLPTMNAVLLYPSLCFFEGTSFSVGRGTDHPFEIFGHPNMSVGSFMFVPKPNAGAKHPKHKGVPCLGWDLTEIGGSRIREKESLILDWLVNAYRDFPQKDKFFVENGFFDLLAGTDLLRKQLISGMKAEEISQSWQPELKAFKRMRLPYLIYP